MASVQAPALSWTEDDGPEVEARQRLKLQALQNGGTPGYATAEPKRLQHEPFRRVPGALL